MCLSEELRPLPKNCRRPLDVPKTLQHISHEHVERNSYKNLTSLPLLLSFNPHLSGCFTKNGRENRAMSAPARCSKTKTEESMSSSEKSFLLHKTLSKY